MKTIAILFTALLMTGISFGQMKYKPSKVIVVVLGPKNPTFDESIYPDLHFYYTPDIKAVLADEDAMNKKFDIQGKPEFLVRAFNTRHITQYGFLLFDKNGICYTEGSDILQSMDISKALCSNGEEFDDNLKDIVKKGETAKVKTGSLSWEKAHASVKFKLRHSAVVKSAFLTGHPFPANVQVETSEGKKVSLESIIEGKPAMVTFIYIPPEGAFETIYKQYHGSLPKPSPAVQKKFVRDDLYLFTLEGQIFGFNSKKALKAKYGK